MSRILLCVTLVTSALASAQARPASPIDCDDNFAECREDCAIKWGGTTNLKSRAKLTPCLNKCSGDERECRDTFFETRRNNLDDGSIKGGSESAPKTAPKQVERKDEDLREDRPLPAPEPKPVAEKKKPELREEEIPKSSRSQISKVDEKPKAEPAPREEPKKPADESSPPPKRSAPPEGEVRARESASPAKKPEKREEPKKEKRRALDEWDPDAL